MINYLVAIVLCSIVLGAIIAEVWYKNLIDEWKLAVDSWKVAYDKAVEALETERILNGSNEN